TAVEPTGLQFSPPCPATVNVRAAATQPDVVVGTFSGYIGRGAPGQVLASKGSFFQQYIGYNPNANAVTITLPTVPALHLDDQISIAVDDGFAPLGISLLTTVCASIVVSLPGTVIGDPVRQRSFVAYPSANAIIEIDPTLVTRNALFDQNVYCWR